MDEGEISWCRVPRRIEREKERTTWPKQLNKDRRKGLAPGPTSFSQEFHQIPHYVDIKGNPGMETVSLTHWHSLWTTGCAVLLSFLHISRDSRFSLAEIHSFSFVSVQPPLCSIRYRCYPPISIGSLLFCIAKSPKCIRVCYVVHNSTMGSWDFFILRESKGVERLESENKRKMKI